MKICKRIKYFLIWHDECLLLYHNKPIIYIFYIKSTMKSCPKVKHKWFMYVWVSLSWTYFIWLQWQKTIILFPVIVENHKKCINKEYLKSRVSMHFCNKIKTISISNKEYLFVLFYDSGWISGSFLYLYSTLSMLLIFHFYRCRYLLVLIK